MWLFTFYFFLVRLFLYLSSFSFTEIFLRVYSFFSFLVSLFSSSLSVMTSFEKVKDVYKWLADHEMFEPRANRSKVDPSRQFFGLEYEVSEEGFLVSDSRIVGGVEEGYFYVVTFTYGFRFPFLNFIMKVLRVYNIAPSQLHPNYWEILGSFFIGFWENDVVPTFRIFRHFYSLKRREG